jgi:6-phosphogluconolactonase (cycloisomerase 2 family)
MVSVRGAEGVKMKFGRWALVFCVASLLAGLAGCGNFWQAPSSSGSSGSGSGTTLSSANFYILNSSTSVANTVSGYYINAGSLTALTGSPYAVSGLAYSMAVDPTGSFAYVSSSNGIYLYTIDSSTGALTEGAQISPDEEAKAIAIDPTGKWLIDVSDLGTISALPITSTGAYNSSISTQSRSMAATTVQQVAFSPSGTLIAVALGSTGTQIFSFTAGNTSPLSTGSNPIAVVNSASAGAATAVNFDPQTRLLYVAETSVFPNSTSSPGGLRAFAVTTSGTTTNFTELSASPFASGGTGPHAILAEANGNYVYVANWEGTSSGNISGFSLAVSGSSYALTSLANTATTGVEPSSLAEDNKGNFVFAISSGGSPYWSAYTFDATTASKLDLALTSSSTGTGPVAIVPVP